MVRLLVLLSLVLVCQNHAQTVERTVILNGDVQGSNISRLRQRLIEAAFEQAIRQVQEGFRPVSGNKDFDLLFHKHVEAAAGTFVRKYTVLNERRKGSILELEVLVSLDLDQVRSRLLEHGAIRDLPRPRLLFLIQEKDLSTGVSLSWWLERKRPSPAQQQFITAAEGGGFLVLPAERTLSLGASAPQTYPDYAPLRLTYPADLVIFGRVTALIASRTPLLHLSLSAYRGLDGRLVLTEERKLDNAASSKGHAFTAFCAETIANLGSAWNTLMTEGYVLHFELEQPRDFLVVDYLFKAFEGIKKFDFSLVGAQPGLLQADIVLRDSVVEFVDFFRTLQYEQQPLLLQVSGEGRFRLVIPPRKSGGS